MDRGQSSGSEEVQQGLPSRLRGQRGRLTFKDHSMSDDEVDICF
jgi:hypothetical protein